MRPPNSRHSLPRNSHIASLLLLSPVRGGVSAWPSLVVVVSVVVPSATGSWTAMSANGRQLLRRATVGRRVVVAVVGDRRLERPAEHGEQQDARARRRSAGG